MSIRKIRILACLTGTFLAVIGNGVYAQEQSTDNWKWGAEIYFWGASLGGTTTSGGDVDLGIDSIVKNLKFGSMAALAAHKDNWTVFGDLIYMDLKDSRNIAANIGNLSIPVDASIELKAVISTSGVGYRVYEQSRSSFDLIGGFRYLWMDAQLDVTVGELPTLREGKKGANWDAIIGFRGKADLTDKWYLTYYGDIGAGQSDFTWQALTALNYRFRKVDVTVGYRYLDWEFDDYGPFNDLNASGVFAGVRIPF